MKKILIIGGGVLVLVALIFVGTRFLSSTKETEADIVEDVVAENASAGKEESEDPKAPASDTEAEESGETSDDGESAENQDAAAEKEAEDGDTLSGNDSAKKKASDDPEEPASASREGESGETPEDTETSEEEDATAKERSSEDAESGQETVAAGSSDEGVLYTINTSAGNNLGMVPIVNGNAVVLMDGSYTSIYQGDYAPEEQSILNQKLEEESALAASEGKIDAWAFYREAILHSYTFPDGVTAIDKFAFARSGLNSVSIPEGVTSIGYGAFYHCDSLTDVTIPGSVTTIEENAFSHTPWLENWMAGKAEEGEEAAEASELDDFLIVGDGILLAYRGSDKNPVLPEMVKSVVPGALGE